MFCCRSFALRNEWIEQLARDFAVTVDLQEHRRYSEGAMRSLNLHHGHHHHHHAQSVLAAMSGVAK
jgi:hypothetical protein